MIVHRRLLVSLAAFGTALLAGCATPPPFRVPTGLDVPAKEQIAAEQELDSSGDLHRTLTQVETPRIEDLGPSAAGTQIHDALPPMGTTPVSVNVQNVPVPVFANEVFGNLLGLNMTMTPEVSKLQDLVTLRTEARQKPQDLFLLTRQLLAEYGVAVTVEGKLVRLATGATSNSASPPLIFSGNALPQVPASHRPVFQLIELDVVRSGDAARWLSTIFGQDIKVLDESGRNSIVVSGKPEQVRQAVEALRVFDRPLMRGRLSMRLEPAFLSAEQLSDRLVDVLNVQGYGANRSVGSPSSIIALPIAATNSVLIFASTQKALDYAVSWARELDKPSKQAGAQSLFYYQVKNTKASDIANVLSGGRVNSPASADTSAAGAAPAPTNPNTTPQSSSGMKGFLQVDEPRNALIYQGEPAQWERMLTLIRQMDKAPRQVMIEVTIAEITLSNTTDVGLNWFALHGFGRFNGKLWSGSGAGGTEPVAVGSGLTWLLSDAAGQNRAVLKAMAQDSRVNILSTPRLMVKSGSEASMDVGDEIPTVSMTTTSGQQTGGSSNLLQSIQYRKTGVLLKIKPTVYSDNRVDIDLSQEVSKASDDAPSQSTAASAASPTIRNRVLNTSLTLKDGETIIMGGLMSSDNSDGNTGVPLVKDIPLLGNLFKSRKKVTEKKELVLVIVPYIVENDEHAAAVSQAIMDRAEFLELEQFPKRAPANPETQTPPPRR
ncbi:hypothetical protein H9L17_06960 [Thermomonas brevis]|uniref:Uncharacterized protein n=1 Tax=Thermomonas brevis TaxID=215691 RepID=A0A7G9QWY2_9GAMM|nr:secretin N-terminal domain-containing protein [Thermomonas brevis]QNN47857.1 hypothetical protein H9L17_06960 [Thermomonas brevis]